MTAITIPRQPHSEWLARLRSVALGLGGRGVLGLGLGRSSVSAAVTPWYLSGGVSAANCLAAYTPKGASSLAASYDNNAAPGNGLADGTYDAAPGVAPTWDAATGWTFNGMTQYLTTGGLTSAILTLIVRYEGASSTNLTTFFGCGTQAGWNPSGALAILPSRSSLVGVRFYSGSVPYNKMPELLTGCLAIVVGVAGYRNGVFDIATPVAPTAPFLDMYLGCGSKPPVPGLANDFQYGTLIAAAAYLTQLTAAQVLAISTAMAAL